MRYIRREVIAGLACAASSIVAGRVLAAEPAGVDASPPPAPVIDVHAHPTIGIYRDLISGLDKLGSDQVFPDRLFFPARFPEWTPSLAIEMMDRNGIGAQILSLPDATVELRGTFARTSARKINEAMAEIVATRPARFGAFAVVPHDDPDSTLAEIAYALDVLRLDGICTTTNIRGGYLGNPVFDPWLDELNRRSAVLFVHPTASRSAKPPPPTFLEFSFDTTRMITNMVLSGAKRRFSRVKLIAAHGGGTAPFLSHRLELLEPLLGSSKLTTERIAEDMRSFYFDLTTCMSEANLAALQRFVGPARLLAGFDTPYVTPNLIAPELARLDTFAGFGDHERHMIRNGNALGLIPRLARS